MPTELLTVGAGLLLLIGLLYVFRLVERQPAVVHLEVLDRYSRLNSPVHRCDARVKIVGLLLFIGGVVLTPLSPWRHGLYAGLLLLLLALSRVPPGFFGQRVLIVLPFVALAALGVALRGSPALLAEVATRSVLSVLAVLLVAATTPFPHLLHGLRAVGVPKLLVNLLSFMFRYLRVLVEEGTRMWRAYQCRAVGPRGWRQTIALGRVVGVFFVRTYERSERIYQAMLARGFDGEFRLLSPPPLTGRDLLCLAGFAAALVGIAVIG